MAGKKSKKKQTRANTAERNGGGSKASDETTSYQCNEAEPEDSPEVIKWRTFSELSAMNAEVLTRRNEELEDEVAGLTKILSELAKRIESLELEKSPTKPRGSRDNIKKSDEKRKTLMMNTAMVGDALEITRWIAKNAEDAGLNCELFEANVSLIMRALTKSDEDVMMIPYLDNRNAKLHKKAASFEDISEENTTRIDTKNQKRRRGLADSDVKSCAEEESRSSSEKEEAVVRELMVPLRILQSMVQELNDKIIEQSQEIVNLKHLNTLLLPRRAESGKEINSNGSKE